MTTDPNLTALRDGLMRFATGCTRDDADKVLAKIIADYGMRPDQLPAVVDILASASGFGQHATALWLYQTAQMANTGPGRMLLCQVAAALARIEATATETAH